MSFIIATIFVKLCNLASSSFALKVMVRVKNCTVLVALDASIDVMGAEWIPFILHLLSSHAEKITDSLTLSLQFLLCVNPVGCPSIHDLLTSLSKALRVPGSKPPLGLSTLDVVCVE